MTHHHHRRSIRLKGYDYTQNGAYFVTLCAHQRAHLFGQVVDGVMVLNEWGQIVQAEWQRTAILRPNVELDAFVVMPNHVHGIIVITGDRYGGMRGMMHHGVSVRAPCTAPQQPNRQPKRGVTSNNVAPNSLAAIIRGFKSAVTRRINRLPNAPGHPIWQRNYYEHIIRNEESWHTIRAYVAHNPAKWAEDSLYNR